MKLLLVVAILTLIGCTTVDNRAPEQQTQQIAKQPMNSLCRACSRRMYTCDVGSCKKCGGFVSSGSLNLCDTCAVALDQCASCGQTILNEPADDLDLPRPHIVSLDIGDDPPSVQKGMTRNQVLDERDKRVSRLSKGLRDWLDANNLKDVTIDKELKAICTLFITCSLRQAELIAKAPNVSAISRGD